MSELCTSTLSFMIYLAALLATDAESATLAERAMRASRKKGDISDTGATGGCAEVNWQLEPILCHLIVRFKFPIRMH
jgi:hypothetical protein